MDRLLPRMPRVGHATRTIGDPEQTKQSASTAKSVNLVNLTAVTKNPKTACSPELMSGTACLAEELCLGHYSFSLVTQALATVSNLTLLLQISDKLSQRYSVHYFSTEESLQQVSLRARRISRHEK